MEAYTYKNDIYEGSAPYIHISYHNSDKSRVLSILEKLDLRGFRFWLNDGIAPGAQTDEIIAQHIENCDFFVAFLSHSYFSSLDLTDELNYSRDCNKDYLLVYLEETPLPAGIDMRFMRAESIPAYTLSDTEVSEKLINIDNADRFYGINDAKLRPVAEKTFKKLEAYYPEHKVFALNSIDKHLAKEISELYIKAEYPSAERLMLDYGFTLISVPQARTIRNNVLYQPGFEPEIIKSRLNYILETLINDYPSKIITDNISKKYPAIYDSLSGLNVWLGYDSLASMMSAYGFSGITSDSGRTAVDHDAVIRELKNRYADKAKPANPAQLSSENPDLKGHLKTLANRSNELFGMHFVQYLRTENLLAPRIDIKAQKRKELLDEIEKCYRDSDSSYGTFDEAESILNYIVIKKRINNQFAVTSCESSEETMKLPYGISIIDPDAFAGNADIKEIILPPTLKEIRNGAFSDCASLERVIFSDGIERIGDTAFSGCFNLKEVHFPASLKYVGNEAFLDCSDLSEVTFSGVRTNIADNAFDGCRFELSSLDDENASPAEYFEIKTDKKNTVKILGYSGDEEIVIIPQTINGHPVVSVEKGCFKENLNIREIYMSDFVESVNGDVFKDCSNLEKIHLSDSVTKFTSSAFSGCTSLTEINIPANMTEIPRGLFKDSPLTTIFIGKSVKSISPDAFYKGTPDFATGAYKKEKTIENLIIDSENESFSSVDSTLISKDGKKLIAELGDPESVIIPEGIEEICAQAYDRISSLREVILPSTLKIIGDKAFAGTDITSIEIPESVEHIGIQAFSYCRSLKKLDLFNGLKTIGAQAFEGCPIEDVFIPVTVESIGNDSFLAISTFRGNIRQKFRVDSANSFIFTDSIALYVNTENGCTLIKAYNPDLRLMIGEEAEDINCRISEKTTDIAAHAFARCNNLASIELPEGLLSIGDMAFWDCPKLKEIRIPVSCTSLSPKAFFATPLNIIKGE